MLRGREGGRGEGREVGREGGREGGGEGGGKGEREKYIYTCMYRTSSNRGRPRPLFPSGSFLTWPLNEAGLYTLYLHMQLSQLLP